MSFLPLSIILAMNTRRWASRAVGLLKPKHEPVEWFLMFSSNSSIKAIAFCSFAFTFSGWSGSSFLVVILLRSEYESVAAY